MADPDDECSCVNERAIREKFDCILRSGRPPTQQAFSVLVKDLQALMERRRRNLRAETDPRYLAVAGLKRTVGEAAKSLLQELPTFIADEAEQCEQLTRSADLARRAMGFRQKRQVEQWRKLQEVLAELRPDIFRQARIVPQPRISWHEDAGPMLAMFNKAMLSTNPDKIWRPSHSGPALKFVVWAIQIVHGKSVTSDAVAKFLERQRK